MFGPALLMAGLALALPHALPAAVSATATADGASSASQGDVAALLLRHADGDERALRRALSELPREAAVREVLALLSGRTPLPGLRDPRRALGALRRALPGWGPTHVAPAIMGTLATSDSLVERSLALELLGELRTYKVIEPLLDIARGLDVAALRSRGLRDRLAVALASAVGSDPRGLYELDEHIERLAPALLPPVFEALRQVGRDAGVSVIAGQLGRDDEADAAAAAVLGAWSPFGKARFDGSCVALLEGLLEHDAPAVRVEALAALGRHSGGGALESLAEHLDDDDPRVRAAARRVLRDVTGRPEFTTLLDWRYWSTDAQEWQESRADDARAALEGDDPRAGLVALRELERAPLDAAWRAAAVEGALAHPIENVARAAAGALTRIRDVRAVPALLDAAACDRPAVASAARAALQALTGSPTPGADWRPAVRRL